MDFFICSQLQAEHSSSIHIGGKQERQQSFKMLYTTAGTEHSVLQPYLVDVCLPLHHPCEGIVEPVLELCVTGKHLGHQEVHERPQLHQVVLQRGACRQGTKQCV